MKVTFTVTNSGSSPVTSLIPVLEVNSGGSLVSLASGPVPSGLASLGVSTSTAFVWTFDVIGTGYIGFTVTADGVDPGPVSTSTSGVYNVGYPSCNSQPGMIYTVAGGGAIDANDIDATTASLNQPWGAAVDAGGNLYIADSSNYWIRKVEAATGIIRAVAGTGSVGYGADGIPATTSQLALPVGVGVDGAGNVYLLDYLDSKVRKVNAITGKISTVVGTGAAGYSPDGVVAATNPINAYHMAVDSAGNIYLAEEGNYKVRKISAATGLLSTVAGTGISGYNGDGIAATTARIGSPWGVGVDGDGNVYIADSGNNRVRKVTVSTGLISTVAGNGISGYNGDGILATSARINVPEYIVVDAAGNIYFSDRNNGRVRKVTFSTGLISTVAGTGTGGYNGDSIPSVSAQLNSPIGLGLDSACRLYIAERSNNRVRRVDPAVITSGIRISTTSPAVGQWVTISFTVTNVGSADVTGISPDIQVTTGGALVNLESGPVPPGPVVISAGTSATFNWSFSVSGLGAVAFSATAAGTNSGTGLTVASASAASMASLNPASLMSVMVVSPASIGIGSWFQVILAVIDMGGVSATSLVPSMEISAGAGLISPVSGPTPPDLASLPPMTATAFVWTYSASGVGTVSFTGSVSGTSAGTFLPITSNSITATAAISSLFASMSTSSSTGYVGYWVQVSLTVTNVGETDTTGMVPAIQVNSGGANVALIDGPVPAGPVTLTAGNAATFSWTYSVSGVGTLNFTATAAGTDSGTGSPNAASASTGINTLQGARLSATLVLGSAVVDVGNWFTIRATVTNTGGVSSTGVLPNLEFNAGGSLVSLVSGPVPAGPLALAVSGATTFAWTFSASGGGTVSYTVTVTGTDSGTGSTINSNQASWARTLKSLRSSLSFGNSPAVMGQWSRVYLTVTNPGTVSVTAVTPAIAVSTAGANAVEVVAVSPPGPQVLGPGTSITFEWTFSTSGLGGVVFSVTATGTDSGSGDSVSTSNVGVLVVSLGACNVLPGLIRPIAGTGVQGYNGDNISATVAEIGRPFGVAVDATGNVYIADYDNDSIRKVDAATGIITMVAGTGSPGYNGDNRLATTATLTTPTGVSLDSAGNIIVFDSGNHRVRKVTVSTGMITTVAGNGLQGYTGDGVLATATRLYYPSWGVVDPAGNIYINDTYNNRIRKVDTVTGLISTVAGNGTAGYIGDGMVATSSRLNFPGGIALDTAGNLIIFDASNHRIRKVLASTGIISTIAGTGSAGFNGDGILATTAQLNGPYAGAVDGAGSIYFADGNNNRIRKIDVNNGFISTIAGTGASAYNGDLRLATTANIYGPLSVALDASCRVILADSVHSRVRRVDPMVLAGAVSFSQSPAIIGGWVDVSLTVTNVGTSLVTGLNPSLQVNSGGALVSPVSGPNPPGPMALSAGNALTFSWTYSVSGAGTVSFTLTAEGIDSGTGDACIAAPTRLLTTSLGAQLEAKLSFNPATIQVGNWFEVLMTVSNTGAVSANAVAPSLDNNGGTGVAVWKSGPAPAGPITLSPYNSSVFTWTYSASGGGSLWFTGTVTGTDSGTAAGLSDADTKAVVLAFPAHLVSTIVLDPPSGCAGQWIKVRMTVTNDGGADMIWGDSSLGIGFPTASLIWKDGPLPAWPFTIPAGGAVTVVWTYSVGGAGPAPFNGWVDGQDTLTSNIISTAASTNGLFGTSAQLQASLAVNPPVLSAGQWFKVVLTVTNTGDSPANGVLPDLMPFLGAGLVDYEDGPSPAGPVTINGNSTQSFTWTYSVSGAGAVVFSGTAAGTDSCSGAERLASAVKSAIIQVPATLDAAVTALPGAVKQGNTVTVTLTVTNTGQAGVLNLAALGSPVIPGSAVRLTGPVPSVPETLAGGDSRTFIWTYRAMDSGSLAFSLTGLGTEANAGWSVIASAVTAPVTVTAGAYLVSSLSASIYGTDPGDTFTVSMTVTNNGDLAANGVTAVLTPADASVVEVLSGPTPSGGAAIGAGLADTFTWTLRILKGGTITYTAVASGEDAGDSTPVSTQSTASVSATERFSGSIVVFPNPVSGNQVRLALKLDDSAESIEIEVYNLAFKAVYRGTWKNVPAWDGILVIDGVSKWAPGPYLVKANVFLAGGGRQAFPLAKMVVKR